MPVHSTWFEPATFVLLAWHSKVTHIWSILLRQYYWYQYFYKGFLHQYHSYTINNLYNVAYIDNKIDRVWGPVPIELPVGPVMLAGYTYLHNHQSWKPLDNLFGNTVLFFHKFVKKLWCICQSFFPCILRKTCLINIGYFKFILHLKIYVLVRYA